MDLSEYKKWKEARKLELPSGLEIKVRPLSPWVLLKARADTKKDDIASVEVLEYLLREFIVEPKLGQDWEIDDIAPADFLFLQNKVFEEFSPRKFDKVLSEAMATLSADEDFQLQSTQ